MFPPQNPDLQPESMWNYELAFSQQLLNGRLTYGVNLFYIDGKNLIETLPNPNGSGMLNQNSGEIENSGIELQAAWRISQYWSVDGNYSYLHMKNPVFGSPQSTSFIPESTLTIDIGIYLLAYNISPDFIHKPIQLKQKNLFYGTYGLHIKLAVG